MSVDLSNLFSYLQSGGSSTASLRQALPAFEHNCILSRQECNFQLMGQNIGLLVRPAPYLGTNRKGAIRELIEQIEFRSPDIVGICEIFDNDERNQIYKALKTIYVDRRDGPDRNTIIDGRAAKEDGGLLLLSKLPPIEGASILFDDLTGSDWLVNKGVLYIKLQPPGIPFHFNIFYTHMQDIKAFGGEGQTVLYKQLSQLDNFISSKQKEDCVSIVFGDINIPADNPANYQEMMSRLKSPIDLWIATGQQPGTGHTFVPENNFYADADDIPDYRERLDYFLMRVGKKFIPIADGMDVLQLKHNGRDISDHFGIGVAFKEYIQIDYT
ncbi:endonuclease/exonuclease/phosphatase family protein [Flavihumibacter fluvii]|uniref:endonuclease/exonuclease/phosphatase family protein n=1 Tax=Flavihumibacter fluvii TaxID=2838157 RepID=UPI001BDF23A2|nr:endonuclease/exonuclease/phosphatase family protein [Flavihumibacter fluvii]ULQ51760.1 endonuclease/exonuclease/phosphatase family protein [Flavihumibacter fluvii]